MSRISEERGTEDSRWCASCGTVLLERTVCRRDVLHRVNSALNVCLDELVETKNHCRPPRLDLDLLNHPKRTINQTPEEGRSPKRSHLIATQPKEAHTCPRSLDKREEFKSKFARFFYSSGLSFNFAENPFLKEAIGLLDRDCSFPSKEELSTTMLDEEYEAVQNEVFKYVAQRTATGQSICFSINGSIDFEAESTLNYVMCFPVESTALFYKFVDLDSPFITSDLLKSDIERVIEDFKENHVAGFVSTYMPNMEKTLDDLIKFYPRKFFSFCFPSGLHLCVAELISRIPILSSTIADCKLVVKYFRDNALASIALWNEIDAVNRGRSHRDCIRFPMSTQRSKWGSAYDMLYSLVESRDAITSIVERKDFVQSKNPRIVKKASTVKNMVRSSKFWSDADFCAVLLRDLVILIKKYESSFVRISGVFPDMVRVMEKYKSSAAPEFIKVYEILEERWEQSLYADIYGISYYLDPFHLGELLPEETLQNIFKHLESWFDSTEDKQSVGSELTFFRVYINSLPSSMRAMLESIHPLCFWEDMKMNEFSLVRKIALQVFSMVPASQSVQSALCISEGFSGVQVYSGMSEEHLQDAKQVYLYHNLRFLKQVESLSNSSLFQKS